MRLVSLVLLLSISVLECFFSFANFFVTFTQQSISNPSQHSLLYLHSLPYPLHASPKHVVMPLPAAIQNWLQQSSSVSHHSSLAVQLLSAVFSLLLTMKFITPRKSFGLRPSSILTFLSSAAATPEVDVDDTTEKRATRWANFPTFISLNNRPLLLEDAQICTMIPIDLSMMYCKLLIEREQFET